VLRRGFPVGQEFTCSATSGADDAVPSPIGRGARLQALRTASRAAACVVSSVVALALLVPVMSTGLAEAATSTCRDVYVLAARGSGESAGFGAELDGFRKALEAALPGRTVHATPLDYTAASTNVLRPSARELGWVAVGLLAIAAADYKSTHFDVYMSSIHDGVQSALYRLRHRATTCPYERVVLAGYSQGAMVMHRVVNRLADDGETSLLRRIAGVMLLGDGDRVPNTKTLLSGSPAAGAGGRGIATWAGVARRDVVSTRVASRTFTVCTRNDMVCDFRFPWSLGHAPLAISVHTSYAGSKLVGDTARSIARIVRGYAVPTPRSLDLSATVGQTVERQLTANARSGSTFKWKLGSGLPAGIRLSSSGLLSGAPTSAGTWTTQYFVQAAQTGPFSDWIPGRVNWTISSPITDVGGVGTIWSWGQGQDGMLGDGGTPSSSVPVHVHELTDVTGVAAGRLTGYALRSDGTVWAWGYGAHGILGDGQTVDSDVPVQVSGLAGVTSVTSGMFTGYALRSDGTVWAWGYGAHGELGNGGTSDSTTPIQVQGLADVVAIAAGGEAGYAVRSDGTIWGWGTSYGGLGETSSSTVPIQIAAIDGATAIAAGFDTAYALRSDGTVWAWGFGSSGELGNGDTSASVVPVQVSGLTDVVSIEAGWNTGYAVASNGSVWAWGYGVDGELGNGGTSNSDIPVRADLDGATAVAGGENQAYAVSADGTVSAWGSGFAGDLGNGNTADSAVPVLVTGLSHISAVAAGDGTGFAVQGP
jgi:hypothetical protein